MMSVPASQSGPKTQSPKENVKTAALPVSAIPIPANPNPISISIEKRGREAKEETELQFNNFTKL